MNDRPRQQILTLIAIALTFASGATDVASFTRLGDVFTSVMTGNIVLWGLAAARGSLTLASHTAVSIAGYITGVATGTWIAHGFRAAVAEKASGGEASDGEASDGEASGGEASGGEASGGESSGGESSGGEASGGESSGGDQGRASELPVYVGWALLAEGILLAGFTTGWEISGTNPGGWAQFCLLAVAAAAMGVQSATVKDMGLSEVSTTYLTGTLTGLVSSLVSPGQPTPHGVRRFGVLIGLAAGAGLSGLLVATAAAGVPLLPLAAVVTALVLAVAPRRWRWLWSRWPEDRGA